MPSFPCAHPTCSSYLPHRGYCADHKAQGQRTSKQFYDSAGWKRARRTKLATTPWCERCQRIFAAHVHHVVPVKVATYREKLEQRYLVALCQKCHAELETELRQGSGAPKGTES